MNWMEFGTDAPDGRLDDLLPLIDMVGDARVIGLGECTHGSREFHRLKHRIVRLLAAELSVSAIVFEANLAGVIRVNEYVLEGRGDPAEVLSRHLDWDVGTEEMVGLLRWLWRHNASGASRIALAGCDMQRIDTAAEIVTEHVARVAPEMAASVAERYERVLEADRLRWLSGIGVQAWFPIEEARGRRVRFSGFIRTVGVTDHACVWGWAGGADGTLAHGGIEGRRPRGNSDWKEHAIVLDVPRDALHMSFGCYLSGNGKAWFDGLRMEIDGEEWRDPERIDLDLSSPELRGFWVDPRNHAVLDAEVTRTGRPTLRVEPVGPAPSWGTGDLEAHALAEQVLEELTERLPEGGAARVLRCARTIVQSFEMRTGGGDATRARSMAENIEWLLGRRPDTRVIFWTHNGQVARGGGETGAFLARALGPSYVSLGFATGRGTCLTTAPRRAASPHVHALAEPPPDSVEQRLSECGRPRMIADLRTILPGDPEWAWLGERRPLRNVGPSALPFEFGEQRVSTDFDLLVWIEETSAARPI